MSSRIVRKIYSTGDSTSLTTVESRITTLENVTYKIAYFESVSATTGTITKPTGSTILLNQLAGGTDALVSTESSGIPTGQNPVTAGGALVDVSSFDASGNYVLTGTPSAYPVDIIYWISITALNYSNLNINNILEEELVYVKGPTSSTNNAIATWNGTTGANIKNNSLATIDSSGNLAANNLSGTNTGDQNFTASGDATAPSSSSDLSLTLATVNSNVGSFTNTSLTVNAKGLITAANSGSTPEVPLTFSTGLTRSVNTITANLSTGVSGGQTVTGGTGASENLTLRATSNTTDGNILFLTDATTERVKINAGGETWLGGLSSTTNPDANSGIIRLNMGSATSTTIALHSLVSNGGASTTQFIGGIQFANYAIGAADKRIASITSSLDGATNSGKLEFGTWNAGTAAVRLAISSAGLFTFGDANNLAFNTSTGTKIGTATGQKIAFWNKTPIIQPTTGITGATLVSNGGTTITSTDTFGGYTLQQLAAIIINTGLAA